MSFGYHNRILRVNLSDQTVKVEKPGEDFYRKYIGGRGIISYYLMKEVPKGADPLGPDNILIFAGGPLTGTNMIGSGRNSVGAKSPHTGTYGDAEAGGYFGAEMKRAGYDAIIIKGQSDKPVYLAIEDENVEIRDAAHLWGKLTNEVESTIKEEMDNEKARVAQIGVAGENMTLVANIVNDLAHFYGRSGMGAVMGSKKLRAIGIVGNRHPEVKDTKTLTELNKTMGKHIKENMKGMTELGTTAIVMSLNAVGGLPTYNFKAGSFEGAEKISGERMRDTYLISNDGCHMCSVKCKRVVEIDDRYKVAPEFGGPEYETLGSLGSCCGVDDLQAVCKGNELCNSLGLDTISTGVTIAFAMECFENGLITKEDTDGIELKFGNGEALVQMIEKIAKKEGFGAILAKGSKFAAEHIGNGAMQYAMEVKGQELPMHEPRFKQGLGVGYMVSPTGADHCHNLHDTAYSKEGSNIDKMRPLGLQKPLPVDQLDEEKAHVLKVGSMWRHFSNISELCQFLPWSPTQIEKAYKAVTGWDTSLLEMMQVTERAIALTRLFNLREGFSEKDDYLPERFYEPIEGDNPLKGKVVDKDDAEIARKAYYNLMGWDENGVPTKATLAELDILWALDE